MGLMLPAEKLPFDVEMNFIRPMQSLCCLESLAAVIADRALKDSDVYLTPEERDGLERLRNDEARHYCLAKNILVKLSKFDRTTLAKSVEESRELHQPRWVTPLAMLTGLRTHEMLLERFMFLLEGIVEQVTPEEGLAFVQAVKEDEPRHIQWGTNVINRMTGDDESIRRFVRQHQGLRGTQAGEIARDFKILGDHLGIKR